MASSLIDDESDLDEESTNNPMTRTDYKALIRKMNMLVYQTELFSNSKLQHMMTINESTVKTLLFESKRLSEENEKIMHDTTTKVDAVLNEVKELKTSVLSDSTTHNQNLIDGVNNFVLHYGTEAKMVDIITRKDTKITSLKEDLVAVRNELVKKEDELLLRKGNNFEI
ncbi:unnamed protein product [Lactuca virosa]|uniref:Uncharacterized protein n=1 Tax=Lactuca virosa TaxID=75947 RepID=A0AAU9MJD3_9ASTR|nr:unnamed protein product [Lactuca virosa]